MYNLSVPPTLRGNIFQQGQTRRLGHSSRVFLQGDSFGFNIPFTHPFLVSKASLTVILESGPRTFDCTLQNQRDLVCRYVVRSGDRDTDGVVALEPGALQIRWSPTDGETMWSEPTVPAQLGTFNLGFPIYGARNSVNLSVNPGTIQEGAGATDLTVTAVNASGIVRSTPIDIPLHFIDVTTSSSDYRADLPKTVTIPGGKLQGSTTISVTAVEDYVRESRSETVRIDPMGPQVLGKGARLQILDAPTIVLSVTPESITEDEGAQVVTVKASLGDESDQPRPIATPITLTLSGTASVGDYAVDEPLSVTIPANARSGSANLTFTPVDDRLLEGDETIVLNGSTTGLAVDGTTLRLADDETDAQIVLAVDKATVLESETSGSAIRVTATLDETVMVPSDINVTLGLAGTATEGADGDYTAVWSPANRRITIPAGRNTGPTPATLTVTPLQDAVAEGDESIVVQAKAVWGTEELVVRVVEITLQDDDIAGVVIVPDKLEFAEGGAPATRLRWPRSRRQTWWWG